MDAFTLKPVHSLLNKSDPFSDGFGPMIPARACEPGDGLELAMRRVSLP
jgi:hypothetical protein